MSQGTKHTRTDNHGRQTTFEHGGNTAKTTTYDEQGNRTGSHEYEARQ